MKVDFACKSIKIESIIKCSLGLSKAEIDIFKFFLKNNSKYFSSNELKEELKFKLSTLQKGLKKMRDKGVLDKKQKNLDKGGYVFEYKIKEKDKIKEIILNIVNDWVEQVGSQFCEW